MKFLFPLAMMMVKAICFKNTEAGNQGDEMSKEHLKNTIQRADGKTGKPLIPENVQADSGSEFISRAQMERSMQQLKKEIMYEMACSKTQGPISFDTFDLVIKTCNYYNSGTDAWLGVRITDDQQKKCAVTNFNVQTSLSRGLTHSFSNLHCESGRIGYPKSIEFKGGSDAYCIAEAKIIPLGSKTVFKVKAKAGVWIYGSWKKLLAGFEGSSRRVIKRNAPKQMLDGDERESSSGICNLRDEVDSLSTRLKNLEENVSEKGVKKRALNICGNYDVDCCDGTRDCCETGQFLHTVCNCDKCYNCRRVKVEDTFKVGKKVVRGPHWPKDQPDPGVGVITYISESGADKGQAVVRWEKPGAMIGSYYIGQGQVWRLCYKEPSCDDYDGDCCDGTRNCCEMKFTPRAVCNCDKCYNCRRVKIEDAEKINKKVVRGPHWPSEVSDPGVGVISSISSEGLAIVNWESRTEMNRFQIGQGQVWHLCYAEGETQQIARNTCNANDDDIDCCDGTRDCCETGLFPEPLCNCDKCYNCRRVKVEDKDKITKKVVKGPQWPSELPDPGVGLMISITESGAEKGQAVVYWEKAEATIATYFIGQGQVWQLCYKEPSCYDYDVDCCDGTRNCCEIQLSPPPAVCNCDKCYNCRRVKVEDTDLIKEKLKHRIATWVVIGPDWPKDQRDPGLGWIDSFREDSACAGCATVHWKHSSTGVYYIGQKQIWHLCYAEEADVNPAQGDARFDKFMKTADFKDERMAGEPEWKESKLSREMPSKTDN